MRLNLGNGVKAIWNPFLLESAATAAFERVVLELNNEFKNTIEATNIFPEFPGQDIVDTGELLRNQRLEISPDKKGGNYEWGVFYARFVHEGYTLRNGSKQPGRPWTTVTIERYKPMEKFKQYYQEELKKNGVLGNIASTIDSLFSF